MTPEEIDAIAEAVLAKAVRRRMLSCPRMSSGSCGYSPHFGGFVHVHPSGSDLCVCGEQSLKEMERARDAAKAPQAPTAADSNGRGASGVPGMRGIGNRLSL